MSVNIIYYKNGAKMMRPVQTEEEYRALRDSEQNQRAEKRQMVQMNYSCLPNEDGTLKGSTTMSRSVGMDIDFNPNSPDYEERMRTAPDLILSHKAELGLLMMERSATKGYHIVFRRREELSQEENLKWASRLLGVEYDKGAKDITRVFYTPPTSRLLFIDKELFDQGKATNLPTTQTTKQQNHQTTEQQNHQTTKQQNYLGIPYAEIIKKWWEMYYGGQEPVRSNRNTLTFELAVNLRHICGFDPGVLSSVIPCYDGFPETEKQACINSALAEKLTQMPKRLKDVLATLRKEKGLTPDADTPCTDDDETERDSHYWYNRLPKMSQGVKDSIDAVGPALSMPVLTAICPVIGMLATGVRLDVHGKLNSLNLIAYIAGAFASGKGSIDPVVDAWLEEVKQTDRMYQRTEEEWRARKRAAKNKKEQPEEPKLPVRCLTLNNTVANLAERLANTDGKHAFSFTPEADTVAQKWRSAMSDFSVMLRQAYDGTSYEREARSAEAVNVHIERLLWNVVMCGTPDALYRVVSNYTDGFQSRITIARTPDNTFTPLTDNIYTMTDRQRERIKQIAHLLPLMQGDIVLPKLEKKGKEWLEQVRLETMKNDDKVKARQRFRTCPTTMRMVTCLMLCRVAEQLIAKNGCAGAEKILKQDPNRWKEMILRTQTPAMLEVFNTLADYQMENALYFFRERIEEAFNSKDYTGANANERIRKGKNDSIFERLDTVFTFDQALQQSITIKGTRTTRNAVHQMLKNWKGQGLININANAEYQKIINNV